MTSSRTESDARALGLGRLFFRARDAVIVGDAATGEIVLWNDAASHLFGYSAEEAVGLRMEMLVPEELKQAHRDGLRRYAGTGHGSLIDSSRVVELPAVRKDGGRIFIELTLTPLEVEPPGRYAMAIIRDVTDRREAARRVAESLAMERDVTRRLRDLDELKNTFVATVAHDVRAPMNAIIGFAQTLADSWDELELAARRRLLASIERSGDRVVRLVEDVLEVAALDSGELPYHFRSVELAGIVERVISEARAAGVEAGFATDLPPDLPAVRADPDRVWQILTNLVGNAARYTPPDSRVILTARREGGMVETHVRDQGPGIPEQQRSRLFEKFTHAGGHGAGTGLGLYICRALVEAQGGRIWLADDDGPGATFVFTLPVAGA